MLMIFVILVSISVNNVYYLNKPIFDTFSDTLKKTKNLKQRLLDKTDQIEGKYSSHDTIHVT